MSNVWHPAEMWVEEWYCRLAVQAAKQRKVAEVEGYFRDLADARTEGREEDFDSILGILELSLQEGT